MSENHVVHVEHPTSGEKITFTSKDVKEMSVNDFKEALEKIKELMPL